MGLQNQLNDVSSDSIPLLLIALIAKYVENLRSFFFFLFHSIGLSRFTAATSSPSQSVLLNDNFLGTMGSGLTGLIVLTEQLNINRVFSYRYSSGGGGDGCSDDGDGFKGGSDCVVCLSSLKDGDQVRKLDCRHVFHKECFDGWLDHLNFICPLCRSPLVSDRRVISTRTRVSQDLVHWFSFR